MKTLKVVLLVVLAAIIAVSCQKEITPDPNTEPDPAGNGCKLTRWIEGTLGLPSDTINVFRYDAQGRISKIIDSGYEDDTRIIKYNAAGKISDILLVTKSNPTDTMSVTQYTYTSSGLLKSVSNYYGQNEYEFNYGADTLPTGMIYHYYDANSQPASRVYRFTWSNGNMVKLERFQNGNWEVQMEAAYSTHANQLKTLAYLDYSTMMVFSLADFTYFNKNLVAEEEHYYYNAGNTETYTHYFTYNFDTKGNVISYSEKLLSAGGAAGVRTFNFTYDCR